VSILLTRLLRQAEQKLASGEHAEAETLCCQALEGASALCNTALVAEAAALLGRIPWTDQKQRGAGVLALHNKAVSMQRTPIDDEAALKLCDALLTLTPPYPQMHVAVHNMAVFIAARIGKERREHYVGKLLGLFDGVAIGADVDSPGIEITRVDGPGRATQLLAQRGAVLIRGLFSPEECAPFRAVGLDYFATHSAQALLAHKLVDLAPLLDTAGGGFLAEAIRPFFPIPPALQRLQTYVRRVAAQYPETTVPFHQDVQAFGRLLINAWTPLTRSGGDAPGLELVVARVRDLPDTVPANDQYDTLQISEATVRARFPEDSIIRPEMVPGDVLVFLGTTIHRTYVRPEMSEQRLSLELRFGME
jgi:hypothetical protein